MWIDKEVSKYKILGKIVYLISDNLCYGRNTVAEWENLPYYLGDADPSIGNAIIAWEALNKRDLTNEELRDTLINNGLMSSAI